ncbi:permease [Haloferula chungangensis]|uniref:Permease n=1 Tax=Haloferula chungangensis TaxID=1048331 RepID=A0ABW2L700_9BACT
MSDCCGKKEPEPEKKSCCGGKPQEKPKSPCCSSEAKEEESCCGSSKGSIDWLLWVSMALVVGGIVGHFVGTGPEWWLTFSHGSYELMSKAWWGLLLGILAVGVIGQVPKELVASLLGRGGTMKGILRATLAGTLLDLCNHGILMVGMQLYKKGASLGQTIAFLVSSPWNSLSLTLILIGLIGWKWTLGFVALSMVIGIIAGWVADMMVRRGALPANPNSCDLPADYQVGPAVREAWQHVKPTGVNVKKIAKEGLSESKMILRWIFFGIVLAGAIRAFVPDDIFTQFFGPSMVGLLLTLLAATVIEVCSEGSSPIAADLLTRAAAPGNAFTFLMAGAATDYTEIMVLRETTKSWKATFALPLLTTPQVLVIAWLLNQ